MCFPLTSSLLTPELVSANPVLSDKKKKKLCSPSSKRPSLYAVPGELRHHRYDTTHNIWVACSRPHG